MSTCYHPLSGLRKYVMSLAMMNWQSYDEGASSRDQWFASRIFWVRLRHLPCNDERVCE